MRKLFGLSTTRCPAKGSSTGPQAYDGVVGLAVDAVRGGVYQLTSAQLAREMSSRRLDGMKVLGDGVFISIVLNPEPEWRKLGDLTRG